jgi:hypothetical protein
MALLGDFFDALCADSSVRMRLSSYERARRSVLNRGYSQRQFEATINAYQETSIFMVDDARTVIKCIS